MKLISLCLLSLLWISPLASQNASAREWKIFRKGVAEYQNGNYELALQSFSLMLNKLPNSALTTANMLMLAKTHYKAGRYEASLTQCRRFLERFPDSKYVPEIYYLTGNNYYRLEKQVPALKNWLTALEKSENEALRAKSWDLAHALARYKMNRFALEDLQKRSDSSFMQQVLRLLIIEKLMDDGKKEKAAALLATSGNRFADGPPAVFFNRLQNRLAGRKTNNWQIALLLPFSGENGVIGKAIEKGARLVVDAYNKQHEKKITLKKYDYKGQLITALEHIRAIADDPNTLLVFGPLENDISAACAAVSAYEGLTMVSPTATEPAITRLSAHSVLLSPTLETRARVLASFAADSLHLKRLAALTPLDDYFIRMEETFKKTLMAHAATLSAEEWYVPGDQSFKKQFRILKRIGLKMSFADSVRTIDSTLTDHAVDSLYRVYRKARLEELKETKTKVDSVDIPVHAFDGMFLPVYKEDIGLMAAQYAFANFQTQVLGNADWYDLRALKKSRNYINGLVFVSDGYLNEDDWNYRRFRNRFREQFKETPDLYALIAYDSFSFLTRVFSDESAVTRATITEALTRQPLYQGIYRRFHIDGSRGNRAVNILKYVYGQLIPLK